MNTEEVMSKLELLPWKDFAKQSIERRKAEGLEKAVFGNVREGRMTGRTTRILVSALVAMSNGISVHVHGHCPASTRCIYDRLRDYAMDLGINAKKMVRLKNDADLEMFDHCYWEEKSVPRGN